MATFVQCLKQLHFNNYRDNFRSFDNTNDIFLILNVLKKINDVPGRTLTHSFLRISFDLTAHFCNKNNCVRKVFFTVVKGLGHFSTLSRT